MVGYKIIENKTSKALVSDVVNYYFNKETGFTATWGKTKEEDAIYSPFGPLIADIEISTICHGVNGTPCKWCSPMGTKISTPNGDIAIEDLQKGDTVFTASLANPKKPCLKLGTIQHTFKRAYTGNLVKITTVSGEELFLTPEHMVILKNGVEKRAEDITTKDELLSISEFKHCLHCRRVLTKSFKRYYCNEQCYISAHNKVCMICGKNFLSYGKFGKYCCVDLSGANHPLRGKLKEFYPKNFAQYENKL